ncbi:MAG TPA: M20/M25/M40 family metallo-hydrolase, partial [Bryobacteraceae bacterium]|nr:M20/M25/M40 family metallo-hydrolase [Bryobacteraceae bacterium]
MAGSLVDRSLLALTRDLVRIPSRAGIDPYGPIYQCIADWLEAKGISVEVLSENGVPLAATATVGEVHKGPTYLLIATADTAGFGEETTWTFEPTSGELCEGWLHGRGSADSKAGIAIFCHVAAALFAESDQLHGAVTLVFDAEEHSGRFLGIQRAMASLSDDARVAGAMIGYPGQDKIVIGCRGFLRAEICIHGKAAHSGSSREHGVNAITRAVELAQNLQKAPLSQVTTREFHLPPQLTITSIRGGIGDSSVPDLCRMRLDIRLTPTYDAEAAKKTIEEA